MNVLNNWYKKYFAIWKLILWAPFWATLQYHNKILPSTRKQRTKNTTKIDPSCPGRPYLTVQFEKIHDWHRKNTINISNNVNLILNTYRCLIFKLLLRNFDVVRQLRPCHARRSARQASVEMGRFWNLQLSKFVNHNGAIMIDNAYGMSTNLPRHGPKWKSANYGLEPCKE